MALFYPFLAYCLPSTAVYWGVPQHWQLILAGEDWRNICLAQERHLFRVHNDASGWQDFINKTIVGAQDVGPKQPRDVSAKNSQAQHLRKWLRQIVSGHFLKLLEASTDVAPWNLELGTMMNHVVCMFKMPYILPDLWRAISRCLWCQTPPFGSESAPERLNAVNVSSLGNANGTHLSPWVGTGAFSVLCSSKGTQRLII